MRKPLGFYFNAVSPVDGAPLVVILTKSHNRKTGAMIQSWILRVDQNPLAALDSGADASICGTCPQRPIVGGKCYVAVGRAPMSIWRAYQRGRYINYWAYPDIYSKWAAKAPLRLGAYGDPAVIDINIWKELLEIGYAPGHTGYSHFWAVPWAQEHKALCMASVETAGEAQVAQAMGWRTFRTTPAGGALRKNEFACPASAEEGKRLTCASCMACNGNPHNRDASRAGSVLIQLHGFRVGKAKHANSR